MPQTGSLAGRLWPISIDGSSVLALERMVELREGINLPIVGRSSEDVA